LVILTVIAALCVVMGVLMLNGKGLTLLAGYNTMTNARRAEIDKKKLSRWAGSLMIRMGIEFFVMGLATRLRLGTLSTIVVIVLIADPIVTVILMNRRLSAGSTPMSRKAAVAAVVMTAVALAAAGAMFYNGEKDPSVTVGSWAIEIDAMYGTDIDLANVQAVTLDERPMNEIAPRMVRTNGFGGFGDALKGNFRSDPPGEMLLFVRSDSAPTIRIERKDGKPVFLSCKDPQNTIRIYGEIEAAL
jgi:preprotein translocase subunit SecG